MPQRVLNENWSDYDNRKIRDKRDAVFFACTEFWEVEYLVSKIKKAYPAYDEAIILDAIISCCKQFKAQQVRATFVESVMKRLRG